MAAPPSPVTSVAVAAATTAPSCITRTNWTDTVRRVRLTNGCGRAYNLKVIWNYATDSACFTLANGATVTKTHFLSATYDKTVLC
jgi:hypothetical protein